MATDVHKPILTKSLANPTSQATTSPCRDHHHKNNQPIPTITAKDRPNANMNMNMNMDMNTNTNKNKNKNKNKSKSKSKSKSKNKNKNKNRNKRKQVTPPETRPLTTTTPPRNPPKTLEEMLTNIFSTIAKYTDDDTAEYVETLMENPCDDDTREIVCGIVTEAKSLKFAAVVCDRFVKIVDVIKKQRKRHQQRDNMITTTLTIASPPTNTKIRPTITTNKTHTPPTDL